ncbi:arginyltransferase [Thaumasiovibrio sp. DFM-14]|uniref:arginyltransferase n=1 Tax=Thaumasiovibrio sp. DFM-14 TaxID=3384792 RepID=UPI0039A34A9C
MSIQVGLTPEKPCSYLPDQKDRLMVVMEDACHTTNHYRQLMDLGFRRSGNMIYRPHCSECQACQPIRVDTAQFSPSRSQKRLMKKSQALRVEMKTVLDTDWYPLYAHYITQRHRNGSMYPPKKTDFEQFVSSDWMSLGYMHVYDQDKLVAIAVCDLFHDAISALYTFFDPDLPFSIGKVLILNQIKYAKLHNLPWLYLGFQIDECKAMNYKIQFQPYQRLINGAWQSANSTS